MPAWLILSLTWLMVLAGIVGAVVPGVPGPALVFGAACFEWLFLPRLVSPWTLGVLAFLAAASFAADWAMLALGARTFGGSRWSWMGGTIGALAGLIFGLAGLFLGAVLGAAVAEAVLAGRKASDAVKAGLGAGLGVLAGAAGRLMICLAMAAWLLANNLLG